MRTSLHLHDRRHAVSLDARDDPGEAVARGLRHDRAVGAFAPSLGGQACDVGLVDGAIDGYAAITWGWSIEIGGLDVVLDELYVRTRRRGLGGRLVEAAERECRERGVKRIFLETERPNDAARRLYGRHGFVADDSIWMSKELR